MALKNEISSPEVIGETWCTAVFGSDFLRGTIVLTIFTELTQFTGYNVLNMFSVRIFTNMNELTPGENEIPANKATQIIGACGFVAVMTSFCVTKRLGRKTMIVGGQLVMSVLLATIAASMLAQQSRLVLFFASLHYFAYNWSVGAVHWYYYAEVLTDRQLGFVAMMHFGGGIFLSLTSEYALAWLTPAGLFFALSSTMLFGFVFAKMLMKETKGLTDREKKRLYRPPKEVSKEDSLLVNKPNTIQ